MSLLELESVFRRELPELGLDWSADEVPEPRLVAFNQALAAELGIDPTLGDRPDAADLFVGTSLPPGAEPVAMAYAGHQFGGYSPRLGDGRALLLGEVRTPDGALVDIHLKGSGRTPFSRGGDGKAALGPMLREFCISEAMHALGVPTARTLAVVATGEPVMRDGGPTPGAVLTRVAASHLRIGTFEYAVRLEDPGVIERLLHHAIARHHPHAADADVPALALLEAVAEAQALLVARWMAAGFIHGVMNTDNTTISGETIDYGPCAFLDRYDPATVYSSIDHGGRYAFANQPQIIQWNLARLAETILALIDSDPDTAVAAATEVLEGVPQRHHHHWASAMTAKLGITERQSSDDQLVADLLGLMHRAGADYTLTFRALAGSLRGDTEAIRSQLPTDPMVTRWLDSWRERVAAADRSPEATAQAMDSVNPLYIPRNHLVEEALAAAVAGEAQPMRDLMAHVTAPFAQQPGDERYAQPAPEGFHATYRTFCGT